MRFVYVFMLSMMALPVWADLQTDMINDKLDRLDREMTLLQKKVYGSPAAAKRAEDGDGNLNDLYNQIDEQSKLITDLTRKVEELSFETEQLKEQLHKINSDVDIRFQEMAKQPEKPVEKKTSKTEKSDKKESDKEAYDKAYQLLVKGKYAESEKALSEFLKKYPDSSLAGNANYWLGETYYVRGQYEVAVGIFSDGLTKYEKSAKAPDNLLKLGLTMAQLKKKTEACGFFKLLPEKFPKASSTLKQRAKQESKKLSCQP